MAKKRYLGSFLRYPKTTQEIKENLDKFDTKIRGKRRNLPTAYDDQFVRHQKSWKYLRRKTQYRDNNCSYEWHEFVYNHHWKNWRNRDTTGYLKAKSIQKQLEKIGCYFENDYDASNGNTVLRWFGPSLYE